MFKTAQYWVGSVPALVAQGIVTGIGIILPIPPVTKVTSRISIAITRSIRERDDQHKKDMLTYGVITTESTERNKTSRQVAGDQTTRVIKTGQTERLKEKADHHEEMTTIADAMTSEAERATEAANQFTDAAGTATEAVIKYTPAEKVAIDACAKWDIALNALEEIQVEGVINQAKIKAFSDAAVDAMKSEGEWDIKIGVAEIKNASQVTQAEQKATFAEGSVKTQTQVDSITTKSEHRQAFTKDLAQKNQAIDALLAKLSTETLKAITDETKKVIKQQQTIIQTIAKTPDNMKKIDACQEHINRLQTLISKTEGIMSTQTLSKHSEETQGAQVAFRGEDSKSVTADFESQQSNSQPR